MARKLSQHKERQMKQHIKDIVTYEAGKPIELIVRDFGLSSQDIIKLASNENPYGVSPKVAKYIQEHVQDMYRYPDDSFYALKNSLSAKYDVTPNNIIIGSGSDQIFEFLSTAVLDPNDTILTSKISFAMYEIYARIANAKTIKTPSLYHDLDEFLSLSKKHSPKIIYLCLPCNPIGDCPDAKDVMDFISLAPQESIIVLDGAYMEYAKTKDKNKDIRPKDIIDKPNVIYTGTFSKAYALGGMRVGYAIANEELTKNLSKVRPPFNITNLSSLAATKALEDEEFTQKCIASNFEQMKRYEDFASKHNLKYIPSYTNFINIFLSQNSSAVSDKLLRQGIIVRDLASYSLNAIRITIGTPSQNDIVLKNLDEVLNGH